MTDTPTSTPVTPERHGAPEASAADLDRHRLAALGRIDRSRRRVWQLVGFTAALEAVLLVTAVLLADLTDEDHRLLLVCSFLLYWTLGMGLVALGAYAHLCTQRVLRAVDTWGPGDPAEPEGI